MQWKEIVGFTLEQILLRNCKLISQIIRETAINALNVIFSSKKTCKTQWTVY